VEHNLCASRAGWGPKGAGLQAPRKDSPGPGVAPPSAEKGPIPLRAWSGSPRFGGAPESKLPLFRRPVVVRKQPAPGRVCGGASAERGAGRQPARAAPGGMSRAGPECRWRPRQHAERANGWEFTGVGFDVRETKTLGASIPRLLPDRRGRGFLIFSKTPDLCWPELRRASTRWVRALKWGVCWAGGPRGAGATGGARGPPIRKIKKVFSPQDRGGTGRPLGLFAFSSGGGLKKKKLLPGAFFSLGGRSPGPSRGVQNFSDSGPPSLVSEKL